jgi:hypothetical protein
MISHARWVFAVGSIISLAVLLLDLMMAGLTAADCSLNMGWGWDCHNWLSFVFIAMAAMVIFAITYGMKRLIGKRTYP